MQGFHIPYFTPGLEVKSLGEVAFEFEYNFVNNIAKSLNKRYKQISEQIRDTSIALLAIKLTLYFVIFFYLLMKIRFIFQAFLTIIKSLTFIREGLLRRILHRSNRRIYYFRSLASQKQSASLTKKIKLLAEYLQEVKFVRLKRVRASQLMKNEKFSVYLSFILLFFSSLALALIIKGVNISLNKIVLEGVLECSQFSSDITSIPYLNIAAKEYMLSQSFYNQKLRPGVAKIFDKLEKPPDFLGNFFLQEKLRSLYLDDLCQKIRLSSSFRKEECYKIESRALEGGIQGLKEHMNVKYQFLKSENLKIREISNREIFDFGVAYHLLIPLIDNTHRACFKTLDSRATIYFRVSLILISIFAISTFLMIFFANKLIFSPLISTYSSYKGIYNHFVPTEAIRRDNNIKLRLTNCGVLKNAP